jgi:predicted enzyme related to lactoylglutathione lyase
MGERSRYEPGTFCWVGLATSDPAAAKAFYTGLFGWQVEDVPAGAAGTFTMLRHRRKDVALLYRQMPPARAAGAPPHWTSFLSVQDADATAARADALGGAALFREPFDVLGDGRVAAISDPTGAIVSLWQPRARIGATLVNDPGAWCWNELATPDVALAARFFADLLGWDYEPASGGRTTIVNAGGVNGSMRELTGPEPAHWLPYFTVEDVEEPARAAERAGGRRLTPAIELDRGRYTVIADPLGAAFAVFEGDTDP